MLPRPPPPTLFPYTTLFRSFPRLLGRYVRELGVLTWEQAVRKATWLGARQFRLDGRGLLVEGAVADLCVFDPDRKSTRLNSSHLVTSYAVFCLTKNNHRTTG